MSYSLLLGDVREKLQDLPRHSVHCCVTSPPYLGLRDYGVAGQIGLEATWQEHIHILVAVFGEVRRVLHPTGVLWVNYGDAYAQKTSKRADAGELAADVERAERNGHSTGAFSDRPGWDRAAGTATGGLKPKDLMGMPWRLALALQEDGWWLRADCIWAKANPTPEPARGRPTMSHEYVFLLAKAARYYYDGETVRVPHARLWNEKNGGSMAHVSGDRADGRLRGQMAAHRGAYPLPNPAGRNLWTVWNFPTQAYPDAHFATFPEQIPRTAILAGTPEAKERLGKSWHNHEDDQVCGQRDAPNPLTADPYQTIGWLPTCQCPDHEPIPCTVLDPFTGSGTTGKVAIELGRRFVGVELNPEYYRMATECLEAARHGLPLAEYRMGQTGLFA